MVHARQRAPHMHTRTTLLYVAYSSAYSLQLGTLDISDACSAIVKPRRPRWRCRSTYQIVKPLF